MFDVDEACQWAAAGGIAIHRNFDVDGLEIGGKVRSGLAFHVMGERDELLRWGERHGLRRSWLQSPSKGLGGIYPTVWHFDVFGALARRLEARSRRRDIHQLTESIQLDLPSA